MKIKIFNTSYELQYAALKQLVENPKITIMRVLTAASTGGESPSNHYVTVVYSEHEGDIQR